MNRRDVLRLGGFSILTLAGCGGGGGDGGGGGETTNTKSKPFATGWTQMPADVYNALPHVTGNDLPDVGFTSYDMSDPSFLSSLGWPTYLPLPGNQAQQPSCTAWAAGYASGTATIKYSGLGISSPISPADVFAKVLSRAPNACTSGAYVHYSMDVLVQEGATTLDVVPYSDKQCGMGSQSQVVNLDGYSTIAASDLLALRASIASNQPVPFGMLVPDSIFNLNGTSNLLKPTGAGSGHAMSLIGFEDSRRQFKIINSWGTQWGANGYCFISYDDFARYATDVCLPWRRSSNLNSLISVNTSNPASPVVAQHIYAKRYGQSGVYGVGVELGWSAPLTVSGCAISVTDTNNSILFTQSFNISQIARGIRYGTQLPASVTGFARVWATVTGTDSAGRVVSIGALTQPPSR